MQKAAIPGARRARLPILVLFRVIYFRAAVRSYLISITCRMHLISRARSGYFCMLLGI
jgi:hypothetical protein